MRTRRRVTVSYLNTALRDGRRAASTDRVRPKFVIVDKNCQLRVRSC
jgi:hypothetical protein